MFFEISEVEAIDLSKVYEISYNGQYDIKFDTDKGPYQYSFDTVEEAQAKYNAVLKALQNKNILLWRK